MRSVPRGLAENDRLVGALDAGRGAGNPIPRGPGAARGTFRRDGASFYLGLGANRPRAHSIGPQTFSRGSRCSRFAWKMPQWNLFFAGSSRRGGKSRGDSALAMTPTATPPALLDLTIDG